MGDHDAIAIDENIPRAIDSNFENAANIPHLESHESITIGENGEENNTHSLGTSARTFS